MVALKALKRNPPPQNLDPRGRLKTNKIIPEHPLLARYSTEN